MATQAEMLAERYGDDPQKVGAVDGTEDDFGDLITEAVQLLGLDVDKMSEEQWTRVQEAAAASEATTMDGFLDDLMAALPTTPLGSL